MGKKPRGRIEVKLCPDSCGTHSKCRAVKAAPPSQISPFLLQTKLWWEHINFLLPIKVCARINVYFCFTQIFHREWRTRVNISFQPALRQSLSLISNCILVYHRDYSEQSVTRTGLVPPLCFHSLCSRSTKLSDASLVAESFWLEVLISLV